jgi:uncharacterized protein YcfJ
MRRTLTSIVAICGVAVAACALAQVTFYEGEGFRGRSFTVDHQVWNFDRTGFNDRAASAVVRGGRWEVCEDARFEGRCITLGPGSYDSLAPFGMDRVISSARPVGDYGYNTPPPAPSGYYQQPGERLYQVDIAAAHAVVGPPEQRCWVERQQVQSDSGPNVPGAIIGGVLGGILGHQVGSGRGRDVATGVGAVGGAAIGANVGRGGETYTQDVQRCATVPGSAQPAYWDSTYYFRGVEHHLQTNGPPPRTITVNEYGEPRIVG